MAQRRDRNGGICGCLLWPTKTIGTMVHDKSKVPTSIYVTWGRVGSSNICLCLCSSEFSPSSLLPNPCYPGSFEGIIHYSQRRKRTWNMTDTKSQGNRSSENFGWKPLAFSPLSLQFLGHRWLMTLIIRKGASGENTPAQQLSTHRKTAWQHPERSCSLAELAKYRQRHLWLPRY